MVRQFLLQDLECYKETHMKSYGKYNKMPNIGVTLKCGLGDRSRSLKMAPIDNIRLYWSVIVSLTLSCTIFELFDVQ